jgi:hypothetical protein
MDRKGLPAHAAHDSTQKGMSVDDTKRKVPRLRNPSQHQARRLTKGFLRYRRTAALHAVRGASYSAGATAVSLIILWARHRF